MTYEQCKELEGIVDRDFKVGDEVWYRDEIKTFICGKNREHTISCVYTLNNSTLCFKEDLTLIPDLSDLLNALPSKIQCRKKDRDYPLTIIKDGKLFKVFYEYITKEGKQINASQTDIFEDYDLKQACYEMLVYLKLNNLLEVKK